MPESDTTILRREGLLAKHGNKAYNGLSAAAIVWLFLTFVQKDDFTRHEDKESVARSQTWQRLMDHEVAIAKIHSHAGTLTNTPSVATNP